MTFDLSKLSLSEKATQPGDVTSAHHELCNQLKGAVKSDQPMETGTSDKSSTVTDVQIISKLEDQLNQRPLQTKLMELDWEHLPDELDPARG